MSVSVITTGRFTIEYNENGRIITVEWEHGYADNKSCMLIHSDSLNQWDDGAPISEAEKQIKIESIKKAYKKSAPNLVIYFV